MPYYRIVAVDVRRKRDGGCLEVLGHYAPVEPGKPLRVKLDRLEYWMSRGAQQTLAARKLIREYKRRLRKSGVNEYITLKEG